ncbi:hypothetical protein ABW21_db0206449 [Orbilia brochopaga]|nr:hypothetical protein ABW21_db0206449 [Drechslerella brochopaga]
MKFGKKENNLIGGVMGEQDAFTKGKIPPDERDKAKENYEQAGTGFLSLLAGKTVGIAKKVTPVLVKASNNQGHVNDWQILDALTSTEAAINARLDKKKDSGKKPKQIIVAFPNVFQDFPTRNPADVAENERWQVTSLLSGDSDYPAELARNTARYPNLIVVGEANDHDEASGLRREGSELDYVNVYALTAGIKIAEPHPGPPYNTAAGPWYRTWIHYPD